MILYLLLGLLIGIGIGYLISKLSISFKYIEKHIYDDLNTAYSSLMIDNATRISKDELNEMYITKELHAHVKGNLDSTLVELDSEKEINNKNQSIILRLTAESEKKITREYLDENYVDKKTYKLLNGKLITTNEELLEERNKNLTHQNTILQLTTESEQRLTKAEVEKGYVAKESFDIVQNKLIEAETKLNSNNQEILDLNNELAELRNKEENLNGKIEMFNSDLKELHALSKEQFKNLATDILEEKKKLFVESNKSEMNNILDPLKLDLTVFKKVIEDTRKEDIQDLTSLKKEIDTLHKLNNQLSDDAQNLANALKSEVKVQGNWGEDRLNLILETEGLQKYIDYKSQETYRDEEQEKNRKPDFVMNLPNGKHIIIDSKVSLTAYVNYFNAANPEEKFKYLKLHLKSITDHIDILADKNYQTLAGLNSPDYVFLFVPIEGALTLALNANQDIFNKALQKKIVLITPTTLISCLKVIKIIWKNENQVKNVEKIFSEVGKLYAKFADFIISLDGVGTSLDKASKSYKDAMFHLTDGAQKGNTLIGRFESLKELGVTARNNKNIPQKFLDQVGIENETEDEVEILTIEEKQT